MFAANGASANILQFCTAAESTDWLQAISTNISELTQEKVSLPLNVSWAATLVERNKGEQKNESEVEDLLQMI